VAGDRWEAGTAPWSESGQYTLVDPPLTTDQAASSALLSASSRESGYRHRLPLTPDLKSVCLYRAGTGKATADAKSRITPSCASMMLTPT
jgi:hypothetical protein